MAGEVGLGFGGSHPRPLRNELSGVLECDDDGPAPQVVHVCSETRLVTWMGSVFSVPVSIYIYIYTFLSQSLCFFAGCCAYPRTL